MKNFIKSIVIFLALLFCVSDVFAETSDVTDKSKVCMMQDSILLKSGEPIEYQGKQYFGCCPMCKAKMLKEPNKYLKAVDPISKNKVDKSEAYILNDDGKAVYFENEKNRETYEKENSFSSTK